MKVLLAGATGAIGIPLTRQLLAHDHQVLGLTRDPAAAGRPAAYRASCCACSRRTSPRSWSAPPCTSPPPRPRPSELGWRPVFPTYHEGIQAMVSPPQRVA
jgi:NAD(P)-dependent dehydrogenase (short-subunit alcohol dehydrogenase family)